MFNDSDGKTIGSTRYPSVKQTELTTFTKEDSVQCEGKAELEGIMLGRTEGNEEPKIDGPAEGTSLGTSLGDSLSINEGYDDGTPLLVGISDGALLG